VVIQCEFKKLILRKNIFVLGICGLLSSCSYVLDEPQLSVSRSEETQENINILVRPLTSEMVKVLNSESFKKTLVIPEIDKSKLTAGTRRFVVDLPPSTKPTTYRIGTGDLIELTTISFENNRKNAPINLNSTAVGSGSSRGFGANSVTLTGNNRSSQSIAKARSRVGADGSILFIETGRLDVLNKTTSEVRDLVTDAFIRNGVDTRFQLEIVEYNSQNVSLVSYNSPVKNLNSDSEIGAALFPITEKPLSLRELLVGAGLILKKNVIELVSIQRGRKLYQSPLKVIFDPNTPNYFLQGGDVITVEAFRYKQEFAYIMGGRSTPFLINVSEEEPVVLANALFTSGGVLSSQASKKSEVYLLRGQDPVFAYHLDATDPARLTLSAQLELRPNDIVFASTVKIVDFNTVLALINPLRILTGQEQPLFSPAF